MIEKHYVWLWVKNPYAKENNNQPQMELRRYRIKAYKEKCVVLFDGRQFPYAQIVKIEVVNHKVSHKAGSEE